MTASRAVGSGEVKALVRQLVKGAGGVEACALELGISHQRVSQLQTAGTPDQMTLMQVIALEAACGRAIVTGALARAVEGHARSEAIGTASVESVGSAAALMREVHAMEADGHRSAGEIRDVQLRAAENLREAQEAHDAAARLAPGSAS